MAVVRRTSMRDQCYAIIKEKILRQEYELGEIINIVELSNELSVSNTPIREALTQLEADGLVTSELNSKARVVSFTSSSFKDMAQTIQILIEGAYDRCIKQGLIPELCLSLTRSLERQESLLKDRDHYGFTLECIIYDRCFFEVLGNMRLLSVFDWLSNSIILLYQANYQKNGDEKIRSFRDHRGMLTAIEAGEHEKFLDLLSNHFRKSND